MSSYALLKQGKCCGNSCRHCPYGHINVANKQGNEPRITQAVLMNWVSKDGNLDVLFWSGGKDSFLTLMHLLEEGRNVILLTSFGALTNRISIQDIHIRDIAKQSSYFKVPLCLVPLQPNSDYKKSIEAALEMIEDQTCLNIERLVFGDLHLRDIRQWRVDTWVGREVYTPLFDVPYENLLSRLWQFQKKLNLSITLSTKLDLDNLKIPVGAAYDSEMVYLLEKAGADSMLESGEGHTLVFPR